MGLGIFARLFGGGRNIIAETVEVFRPNAEASAQRAAGRFTGTQQQYAAEFAAPERKGWFNSLVDGLNRLPRPLIAFGVIGLFGYALRDPIGFAVLMAGLALIPEQLWWLMGAVVSFYFGARELHHFRSRSATPEAVRTVVNNIEVIRSLHSDSVLVAQDDTETESGAGDNPALDAWRVGQGA
ncbi:MAG: carboxylesterase [Robiginitomaculum sp.]|nr:MAG: carboxylesterase [Robiginitomaculum sp.]